MKKSIIISALAVLILVSLGVVLYPLIANCYAEKNRSLIETQYTEAIRQMDSAALDAARTEAQAYNSTLVAVTDKPFTKDALVKAAESYDSLLNVRGDGIMGYVEIPRIGVKLPIFHGTEESTLNCGVGHLLGSSLPVGGTGTHCLLTGHSGLAGQKMFSDLNLLQEGDVFFLRVLGQTLAYRVCEINTVLPEDTGKLGIDAGRDLCTLVTCTPYGVNSHRLLVRGERTEYEEAVSVMEAAEFSPVEKSTWGEEYRRGLLFGVLAVGGIGGTLLVYRFLSNVPVSFRYRRYCPRGYVPKHSAALKRQSGHSRLNPQRKRGKHEIS